MLKPMKIHEDCMNQSFLMLARMCNCYWSCSGFAVLELALSFASSFASCAVFGVVGLNIHWEGNMVFPGKKSIPFPRLTNEGLQDSFLMFVTLCNCYLSFEGSSLGPFFSFFLGVFTAASSSSPVGAFSAVVLSFLRLFGADWVCASSPLPLRLRRVLPFSDAGSGWLSSSSAALSNFISLSFFSSSSARSALTFGGLPLFFGSANFSFSSAFLLALIFLCSWKAGKIQLCKIIEYIIYLVQLSSAAGL